MRTVPLGYLRPFPHVITDTGGESPGESSRRPSVDPFGVSVPERILHAVNVQVRHLTPTGPPAGPASTSWLTAKWSPTQTGDCHNCGLAVLEHIRTDLDHRHRGCARRAVSAPAPRPPSAAGPPPTSATASTPSPETGDPDKKRPGNVAFGRSPNESRQHRAYSAHLTSRSMRLA